MQHSGNRKEEVRSLILAIFEEARGPDGKVKATEIADKLLVTIFADTATSAKKDGSFPDYRNGIISRVKKEIKGWAEQRGNKALAKQADFMDIEESYRPFAMKIGDEVLCVNEKDGVFMTLSDLIEQPDQLEAAEKILRKKGKETLQKANAVRDLLKEIRRRSVH